MSITRKLPRSGKSRLSALKNAAQKTNSVAASNKAITKATNDRLDNIVTQFNNKSNELSIAQAVSIQATTDKNKFLKKQGLINSHYVQVLNMHIEQGIFPASYRAFYKIDTNSSAVPVQTAEDDVVALSENIIAGETNIIAAGGSAIPFPLVATVKASLKDLTDKQKDQSTKKDATDAALEAIEKLNVEADAVIKKVWDEVETFYNEEPIESVRKKAREWGVVYVSTDVLTTITGTIINATTKAPIEAVTVDIDSSDETTTSNTLGKILLSTGTIDAQVISIEKAGFVTKTINVKIVAGQSIDLGVIELVVV